MAFSATEAAFEGFRVVRRHPMAVVFWALFYVVVMAAGFALVGGSVIGLMSAAERLEAAGTPTAEEFMPVLQAYLAIFAVILPLSLIASAVLYTGISRAVLRPAESAFGYLRLGMDEVRVFVVSLVLGLAMMVLMALVFAVVSGVGAVAVTANAPALWLVVVVVACAAIALTIWLAVRFCLAIPITVAQRRIAIMDSFAATRGRFWPLLGMALLAVVMCMVVSLLGMLIFMPVQMATGGLAGLQNLEGESLPVIIQTAWPAVAGWILVNAVMSALQVAVLYAPFSAAYRDIAGTPTPAT